MKLALLADVHANLEALSACLEHAEREGADAYAFLGDLVGYGADPAAVLAVVRRHAERGALAVRGNHDAAVLDAGADTMHRSAEEAVLWTRGRIGPADLAFLRGLPLVARAGPAVLVHASADRPADWTYVSDPLRAAQSLRAAGATYVFSGHVHEPVLYFAGPSGRPVPFVPVPGVPIPVPPRRRWLAVVGSVGQPRDGKTAACWALFDTERERLVFHRVPYDVATAAAKVRAAGLPEHLALRLLRGE
jgi:diadenosine tetraphosphatase ApaH/serine/threonine PP2A family protein phosphatase